MERKGRIKIREQMTLYYHGSNAASLVGFFDKEEPGLKPLKTLLEAGKPPFCGELNLPSKQWISAVEKDCIGGAMRYTLATFGRGYGWTPERSREERERERKKLIRNISHRNIDPELREFAQKHYDHFVHVELLREKYWKQLSEEERAAVKEPFPVVYQIEYYGKADYRHSDIPGECTIDEKIIPLNKITLFVPQSRCNRTKERWLRVEKNPRVLSFEKLRSIIDSITAGRNREDAERNLERLLEYKA